MASQPQRRQKHDGSNSKGSDSGRCAGDMGRIPERAKPHRRELGLLGIHLPPRRCRVPIMRRHHYTGPHVADMWINDELRNSEPTWCDTEGWTYHGLKPVPRGVIPDLVHWMYGNA